MVPCLFWTNCKAISDPVIKKRLTDITQETLDQGCFGAPWTEVTNAKGQTDRFFGSDRWDHICDFLGEEYLGYCPEKHQARL
jgi:2-hydroxychromene-2-carboxylate isomerase